jgi:hypothetical protein
MAEEQEYSKGNADDMTAQLDARLESAVEEARARYESEPRPEIAELEGWWNLWAYGPVAVGAHFDPHVVIKAGETARIYTILWIRPWGPPPTPCTFLTNLACKFEVRYCTGDLCSYTPGPGVLNGVHEVDLVPNQCWYRDYLEFTATRDMEGFYETNISARIVGCAPEAAPPFAGFASRIWRVDWDVFYPYGAGERPGYHFYEPFKFMIYR